jgi:hypothetical protein
VAEVAAVGGNKVDCKAIFDNLKKLL